MQKFFNSWRGFIQEKEPEKEKILLNEISRYNQRVYDRIRQYDDIISRASQETGLSKAFIYGTIYTESRGRATRGDGSPMMGTEVFSTDGGPEWRKRAQGMMQVSWRLARKATQRGLITQEDYDSGKWRTDPELNILIGSHYIARQRRRLMSDTPMRYGAWRRESAEQAQQRAERVRNMDNDELENLLHVAYSHGPHHSQTRRIALNGYSSITSSGSAAYKYPRRSQIIKDILAAEDPNATSTTSTSDPGVRNVIISGNSHAGGMAGSIKQHYENLGQQTGVRYNFVEIHEPQGHGGQVSALSQKMDTDVPNKLEGNNIAAIIHVGTNTGHGNLDELIEKYKNLSNNVTFVGTPEANRNYEHYQQRTDFNTELENKINNLDGVNFVNTFGLTTQNDLSDNIHLRTAAYENLWSQIQGNITFDSSSDTSPVAGGPSTSTTPGSTMRGEFVHGFERQAMPDFNFDEFYKKLDDASLTHHLGDWGKDYKYGRAHDAARTALASHEASRTTAPDPTTETPETPENMPLGTPSSQAAPMPPESMPMAATETAPIPPENMPISQPTQGENVMSNLWNFWVDDYMRGAPLTPQSVRENKDLKNTISREYSLIEQSARWSAEDLIKVDMALKFDKEFSFYGNVLNQIRAVKGITIAKADEAGLVKIYPDKRLVLLHLKFMPDRPLSQYIYYLKTELKKIKDKDGDRVLGIELKSIPEKTKS